MRTLGVSAWTTTQNSPLYKRDDHLVPDDDCCSVGDRLGLK